MLSYLGVRSGEIALNGAYKYKKDANQYTLLWKDVCFLPDNDVAEGAMPVRAVVRIRNGKGEKMDPSTDFSLNMFSRQPQEFLLDPVMLLLALGIRMGAIDGKCLQATSISIRSQWLETPVFVYLDSLRKLRASFTNKPLIAGSVSKYLAKYGKTAQLTQPIRAHDLRRGYIQDIRGLSDTRTAQESVGHAKESTTKVFMNRSPEPDKDWTLARMGLSSAGEGSRPVRKKRCEDPLLPPLEKREALRELKAPQLNAGRHLGEADITETENADTYIDNQTNEIDLAQIDPVLRSLGASSGEEIDLENDNRFTMLADFTPFDSGPWIDFVTMMAHRNSRPPAPDQRMKVTAASMKKYHVFACDDCCQHAHSYAAINELQYYSQKTGCFFHVSRMFCSGIEPKTNAHACKQKTHSRSYISMLRMQL